MTNASKMEVDIQKGEGFRSYYIQKIEELQLIVAEKNQNLRRLQAQRNELNAKVRMLREELQLLQEQGSYVGEVVKPMDKKKVLVKVHPEGKFVVDIDKNIDINDVTPNCRVALRNESYTLHKILPNKVDPLVSLMMVEKVPDSTYEMVGGLDKQIKEIKEVIELPVKHPELFDALGIAQPKGVLLYGPPGTGKTLLARAVAHHTECTFIRVSGSELVQKFIGEGSRMVRELFVMAREHAPSIIFMDEIDSIGSSRIDDEEEETHQQPEPEPLSKKMRIEEIVIEDDDDEDQDVKYQQNCTDLQNYESENTDADGFNFDDFELVEGQEVDQLFEPEEDIMDNNAILSSILLDAEEDNDSGNALLMDQGHYEKVYPYECEFCRHRYSSLAKLESHVKTHSQNRMKCFICGRMVVVHLLRHLRSQHPGMSFPEPVRCWHSKCAQLDEVFLNVNELLAHMETKRRRR